MNDENTPPWAAIVGALIILVIVGSIALVAAGGWAWFARFLESAAPAWVQAIGSIAAILITGSLWYFDNRRREGESLQAAQLVASEISERLAEAASTIKGLSNVWGLGDADKPDPENYLDNIRMLQTALKNQTWRFKRETLVALVPLPKQSAHRIARASDQLKLCHRQIRRVSTGIERGNLSATMIRNLHSKLGVWIELAQRDLSVANEECIKAARLGAPPMSAEELYG